MEEKRTYIAIDLKSFYASVECQERGLDPLNANLVVADTSRSEKTICLAVSPSLKAYGIPGRARLFEVIRAVDEINRKRSRAIHWRPFTGSSMFGDEIRKNPYLKLDYLAAVPRMSLYIQYSTRIYEIYLRYISPDDIHVYSIDECFIDATSYLKLYHIDAHSFARFLIQQIMNETGITATAGIGTNMFLCKAAMDIVAKHIPGDQDGVRIAEVDEYSYRKLLWTHRPLTDFWRVGPGIARRLEAEGMYTMGDVARCSIGFFQDYYNEDLLYKMFGKNAELLIDHAWGYEPCTMQDIKTYQPSSSSTGIGQVLASGYAYEQGLVIVKEMADSLALDLVKKNLVTDEIVLWIGYDRSSVEDASFKGDTETDWYGRSVPKGMHASMRLGLKTASSQIITQAAVALYEKYVGKSLLIRRVNITAIHTMPSSKDDNLYESIQQTSLFEAPEKEEHMNKAVKKELDEEKKVQEAILKIKEKYGKNAVVKGMDFEKGATTIERNGQIGGHKA
jgi:DNA polymerase V